MEDNELEKSRINAEEDYIRTPISVLAYITRLEQRQHLVDLMKTDEEHGMYEPTAEDILAKHISDSDVHWRGCKNNVIQAMEEYKNSTLKNIK
jgi:hypothetical protein